ncbi:Uncharacterised protein [Leminorella richardii]|uniref:Uncharacterized protein n=2 Tax=Leminorella richardii TaxID=158841 RepID=A0A2X4UTB6_9GAMM|nr:Uncharacterised protein [Leminorella richardii]
MNKGIAAMALAFCSLYGGSAFADALNDYLDARPVVKKDLRVRIVLRHLTREIAKENSVKVNSPEYQQRTEEFARLATLRMKNMCIDGTLEQETGLATGSCKVIEQIRE